MQLLHSFDPDDSTRVDLDLRVLLCCPEGGNGAIAQRLAALGTRVQIIDALFSAMTEVTDGPAGYSVLVVNCDSAKIGGLAGGQKAIKMMGVGQGWMPVILISRDCVEQRFPEDRLAPIELRAPATSLALRIGIEHALRERLACLAA